MMKPSVALKGWLPWRMSKSSPEALCEWIFTGERAFTEPFFDDTVAVCRREPENNRRYRVVSSLDMLGGWAEQTEALSPSAIIFHVSRCGSTLLSQLLACDPEHLVLSEVPFFDELLRLPFKHQVPAATTEKYLGAALRLYGQKRTPRQQRLFIKTDSWHLHFYETFRTLFPATPFILLYRHPSEVLRSQQKQRGLQSIPGVLEPQLFGFEDAVSSEVNLDRYMAGVLHSYFDKISRIIENDPLAFAFNYKEGIGTLVKQLYRLLHFDLSKETAEKTAERCRYHAKHPQQVFAEALGEAELPAYLEPSFQLYQRLERINRSRLLPD